MKLVKEQVCRDIPGQECKIELVNYDHDGDHGGGEGGGGDGKDVRNDMVQICRILLMLKKKKKKKMPILASYHQ